MWPLSWTVSDRCDPARFRRQVEFLGKNPDIDPGQVPGASSTNFVIGLVFPVFYTSTDQVVADWAWCMYFRNIFIHPTVMWRATVAEKAGSYPENFPYAEDYGFFYEIISKGKAAVLPENLVICEINPKGLSLRFRKEQLRSRGKVVWHYGKNRLFALMGVIKLRFLMVIPYGWVFQAKKWAYGIRIPCVI